MAKLLKTFVLVAAVALAAAPAAGARATYVHHQLLVRVAGERQTRIVELPGNVGVGAAAGALRRNPNVRYAVPNYIASASSLSSPNDPGKGAGWQSLQWNFLTNDGLGTPRYGVDALGAWQHLIDAHRPGAAGVKIAVIDSGVAYRNLGKQFKRSPDFAPGQFAPGYDFVARSHYPLDLYGHGTLVAGTIAEQTDNGIGVTGLAYGATIMPIRVLNRNGNGSAANVARGIRFAAAHGAQVINLSLDFPPSLGRRDLPDVNSAITFANRKGALIVAAAGNRGRAKIPWPAAGPNVVSVGASTRSGCLAGYSNRGPGLDIVAPGGDAQDSHCSVPEVDRPAVVQMTLAPARSPFVHFGLPGDHFGTSEATPHVSAIAAMVIASGVLGAHHRPTQQELLARLQATGDPLPPPFDYVKLVDAAAATAP